MTFLFAGHAAQRDVFGQRLVGDHHGGGVRADVTRQALDLAGQVDDFPDFAVRFVDLAEIAAFLQGLVQRDVQIFRHHRGNLVDARQRNPQRTAHVLDRRPRRQGAEGADLSDVLLAVLLLDVANDLAAAILAEVDVDVGCFLAAFVQEPLEQQVISDRAHVAQVQGVRDQRPHAAAAGRGRHAHLAHLTHEVPHDQEVVGKAQLADHAQLAVQAVEHHLGQLSAGTHLVIARVAFVQALQAQLAEELLGGLPFRQRCIDREVAFAQVQVDVHRVGNLLAAGDCVFQAGKGPVHLLRAAEEVLIPVHPHPVRVRAEFARVDAQHNVLGFGILGGDVVAITGGDQRNVQVAGQFDGCVQRQLLDLDAVVHDLDEVAVPEQIVKPLGDFLSFLQVLLGTVPPQQRPVQFAGHTAAQAEDALVVLLEQFLVDTRLEVEPFQVGRRGHFEQVLEPGAVLAQQRQMVAGFLHVAGRFLPPAAGGDVRLVADDRLQTGVFGFLIELQRTVQIAVVGQRQRVHPVVLGRSTSRSIEPAPSRRL